MGNDENKMKSRVELTIGEVEHIKWIINIKGGARFLTTSFNLSPEAAKQNLVIQN